MVTRPMVHGPSTTVGELRAFFRDDHVHIALVADADTLIGTVERADLTSTLDGETPARAIARLDGRTIRPAVPLSKARDAMRRDRRRRLVVTTDDSTIVGLLCLKARGLGFCSDDDVRSRRHMTESSD